MPKKNKKSEFTIIGDVKLKVLHETKIDRTTLTLYIKLPAEYVVVLKEIISIPDIEVDGHGNRPIKEEYKKIKEEYNNAADREKAKKEFLKKVKEKYGVDWRKVAYQTTFYFCILYVKDSPPHTQYMHYQLAGANNSVSVNINPCEDIVVDAIIKNLIIDYSEKINK